MTSSSRDHDHDHSHDPAQGGDLLDRGLHFDLAHLRDRRAALKLMGLSAAGLGGAAVLLGSGAGGAAALASSGTSTCTAEEIPEETAGPYPGDGSNGPDVLTESGVVRRDIRRSFGDSTTKAPGVKHTFVLRLTSTETCKPLKGLAVYAWHCNREGKYSMYSEGITDENYLRGVQVSNAKGRVRFTSIYPACYSGRWPHIHFEVYANKKQALNGGDPIATSQMAMRRKPSMHVYRNATGYSASVKNLESISLSSDNVFGDDNGVDQLPTTTGSIEDGYHSVLHVPIDL
ncbi:dioxygenase family protein [Nocardioides acrostichi]|uniref:3,4-dioxygenase subunit beta n=1 Tax=Nocardioides acrostichi TaxID=2784339 RepID=A0A930Y7E7_9ACTN|nr:3,4-dioxygenase subunit beta [Nocardioides acrostichi]MBF4163340.1 3,4-dioxygenase subunit beta [Nocardioides acrostichi]